jgi:hypothetical protein
MLGTRPSPHAPEEGARQGDGRLGWLCHERLQPQPLTMPGGSGSGFAAEARKGAEMAARHGMGSEMDGKGGGGMEWRHQQREVRSSVQLVHGGRALSCTCDVEDDRGGEHGEQEEWGVGEGLRVSAARARAAVGSLLLKPWWRRSARVPSKAGRGQGASERARASESGALPLPKMQAREQGMRQGVGTCIGHGGVSSRMAATCSPFGAFC